MSVLEAEWGRRERAREAELAGMRAEYTALEAQARQVCMCALPGGSRGGGEKGETGAGSRRGGNWGWIQGTGSALACMHALLVQLLLGSQEIEPWVVWF